MPSVTIALMELKKLLTQFVYRIEPKPEGGFIARPSDPNLPPLEAPTREELQRKIQANIASSLANEFPGLKLPQGQQMNISFHIEHKPDGSFDIHSSDPAAASIQGASGDEVESQFAEKLLALVGKHLAPEFSQALGAQLGSGNVKVFVSKTTKNVSFKLNGSSTSALEQAIPPSGPTTTSGLTQNVDINSIANNSSPHINASDNSPIRPGGESSGTFIRFIIAALIVLAAMYTYVHFHH